MPIIDIPVPQMGEGLQEVVILKFLKWPGDIVRRDEHLYNMETDKAVMEVESPYDGVLTEWLSEEGAVMAIGATIARMEVAATSATTAIPGASADPTQTDAPIRANVEIVIPPRTRAYCREKQIDDETMRRIPAQTGKLLPSDVDAYLAAQAKSATGEPATETATPAEPTPAYSERPLTTQQRTFIYRIKRSAQLVVPATAKRSLEWGSLKRLAESIRQQGGPVQPSSFQIFAYCVVRALKEHLKFRSVLIGEATLRQYDHVNVGIAVGLPDGELTVATVPDADTLNFPDFIATAQARIQRARDGEDQASDTTQFLLTYMGPYELTDANPVLVAPAVAVLFIGSTYEQAGQTLANLALTFDHRVIGGIEAAEFLRTTVQKASEAETLVKA